MITKRRLALLSSLTTAPAFAAPFLAIGNNAELFLTARTEVRYEDNITFSSQNELEDEVFEVSPGAEIIFGKNSLVKGSFSYVERITSYSDYNDLNSNLSNLVFATRYDGARLDLDADASFRELNQNTRDVRNAATLVRRDVYSAGVEGEYALTAKSKVALGAKYHRTQYKVAGFNDQTHYTIPANYYFAITEKVDLSAGFQYRKRDVDNVTGANSDSDEYYFNVGARGEFTAKLSGKFNVGYLLRDPEAAGADDDKTIGVRAGLIYAYSPKTRFTLDLSNDFETGSDARGNETASITLGANTSLTAAWSVGATIGYSKIDYLSINREDDYFVGGVSVTYVYNEHVNFQAGYSINDNSSDLASAEFTANVVRIAANFRY
jgi:Uncharacterized protein conserved in bacteria